MPRTELALLPLIDDAKCFAMVRKLRWPEGVSCRHCESMRVTQRGMNETRPDRQRYMCGGCGRNFDDLTDTILAGQHQPLRVWLLCLYFMGLNLSNRQIAHELGVDEDSAHEMATQLRTGIVAGSRRWSYRGKSNATKSMWLHAIKGIPRRSKKGRLGRRRRLKGDLGRGTLAKGKPPLLCMIQRTGEVVLLMLSNVQQATIGPILKATISPGTTVYIDEYDIYSRLTDRG